ncbi:MAG: hypothetical protein LUD02_04810, partial [Tannerellaceae bacterium]|nr:hypothetical protein [Tannerellaceae bacterium]
SYYEANVDTLISFAQRFVILNSLYVEGPDQKIAAFKSYYEANVDTLISFAQRFVSFGLAEDLVHDVFSGSLELS